MQLTVLLTGKGEKWGAPLVKRGARRSGRSVRRRGGASLAPLTRYE